MPQGFVDYKRVGMRSTASTGMREIVLLLSCWLRFSSRFHCYWTPSLDHLVFVYNFYHSAVLLFFFYHHYSCLSALISGMLGIRLGAQWRFGLGHIILELDLIRSGGCGDELDKPTKQYISYGPITGIKPTGHQ